MKRIVYILNLVLPTILFYWVYSKCGIIPAPCLSVLVSGIFQAVQFYKTRKISNTAVLGLLGLIIAGISISFTGNEKYYYVPGLVKNMITIGVLSVLLIQKKSVLHYLTKDFEIAAIEQIPQENMRLLNVIWLLFFGCKIMVKIIGIIYLDFHKLYWLVFLMGDPAMVLMIVVSVIIIRFQLTGRRQC